MKRDEEETTSEPRIVTRPEHNAATSFRDHAGGEPSPAKAINARPNDVPTVTNELPANLRNSTLAERAKRAAKRKQVDDAENKAVTEDDAAKRKRK